MQRVVWALVRGRPVVQIDLHVSADRTEKRTLLADTGAGSLGSTFEVVLKEEDCRLFGRPFESVSLRGAYHGAYGVHLVRVGIPEIGRTRYVRAVGVAEGPPGLDGIACFRFLNSFTFGNFGGREQFGIETS